VISEKVEMSEMESGDLPTPKITGNKSVFKGIRRSVKMILSKLLTNGGLPPRPM
jgi:hypothetical protein